MWDSIARWCINLSFVLLSYALFTIVLFVLPTGLSAEANYTIASLLCIALSDLYLGNGRK